MLVKTLYIIMLGVLLSLPIYADSSKSKYGATVINLAGKQRMLTQKMSKEALLIIKGIAVKENRENLKETIFLFNKTLFGLRDGDSELNLPKTKEDKIIKALNREIKLWNLFQKFLNKIVDNGADKNTLKAVEIANMPLLKLMNDIVLLYEKKYASDISPNIARTINLAGRERMLIQKMTKELLLIANNIKSDTYIKSLKSDGLLFQNKLSELIEEKSKIKEQKLRERVENIQELWEEYKRLIASTVVSSSGEKAFNHKKIPLVKRMTKELVEVAEIIDSKRYQINLDETERLFDTTLTALMKSDSKIGIQATTNKTIQKQLKIVQTLWKEYQPIIVNVDTSKEGLVKAMEINMPLLKEIDKAVKLYEVNFK
jgi:hypothetical protein